MADKAVTKRQVGQMISARAKRDLREYPPGLDDLKEGEEVDADLMPGRVGPGNPEKREFRRYYRRHNRLFYFVLNEVR